MKIIQKSEDIDKNKIKELAIDIIKLEFEKIIAYSEEQKTFYIKEFDVFEKIKNNKINNNELKNKEMIQLVRLTDDLKMKRYVYCKVGEIVCTLINVLTGDPDKFDI